MTDIVILGSARTAIGGFGGSLARVAPIDLAATVARAALARAGVEGGRIGHVVFGHVINTEPRDMYLSRVAAMQAGIPAATPAMNVNRLCGSGAQAIVSAMQSLLLGDAEFALAGGAESMSRAPYVLTAARWGQKMGDTSALDMMTGALTCPFGTGHMGVTAENVASERGISRADQDAFALESQVRAARAIVEGRFRDQIVPVEIFSKRGGAIFDTDEHPKATSLEALAALRPAFQKDGTVTAGNASGLNDGAAALVLARAGAKLELPAHSVDRLTPTLRPTQDAPPEIGGIYVHNWFTIDGDAAEEFVRLSGEAWPDFEARFETQIYGLFLAEASDADRRDGARRLLLMTRYRDLGEWQVSRDPTSEAMKVFLRRRELTRVSLARACVLMPIGASR